MNESATAASAPPTPGGRVLFAITTAGNDLFSSMTRIAIASLRITNPHVAVVVACDAASARKIRCAADPLGSEADDWLVVDTPDGTDAFRNRFVKTSLREQVDGPFLFLDSDVLVRARLDPIFAIETDVAVARNHSRIDRHEQFFAGDVTSLSMLGWQCREDLYANGGVIYYRDTSDARTFARNWHERWGESAARTGTLRDQPALNAALFAVSPSVTPLDDRYNAQFKMTPLVAREAAVWHYYASNEGPAVTAFEIAARELAERTTATDELRGIAERLLSAPHPWRRHGPIDDLAAERVIRRDAFDGWEGVWLARGRRMGKLLRASAKRRLAA